MDIKDLPTNLNPTENHQSLVSVVATQLQQQQDEKNIKEYYSFTKRWIENENRIAKNLLSKEINENIPLPEYYGDNSKVLHQEIQEKLYQKQPELALDRLHTFATSFLRKICDKYKIDTVNQKDENLPLHNLIGSLVKKYEKENLLSDFSIRALKMSISIFEKYNDIRNDQSYAHDNEKILNKNEAQFAVTVIINLLNFIDSIENKKPYTSLFYIKK